ncbi:unnamed protein product, partial [Ectocarpus sp. 12 AP-2014]
MATDTAGAAGVSAVAEPGGDEDDDDDGWLFAAACSDEIGGSPDAIGRYAAIIKDSDAHVYRRGMAVLAMGKALGRELGKLSGNSASVQKFRQECGGAGGVLDSVLDILGQCTVTSPTRAGKRRGGAPALLAGCGVADALAIRTNCCALVSLLASALLGTAATTTTVSNGAENVQVAPRPDQNKDSPRVEENDKPGGGGGGDGDGEGRGADPLFQAASHGLGVDACTAFVPMSAKPNPDVVCLVRKKGWAARQQQQQQHVQPTEGPEGTITTRNSNHSRVCGINSLFKTKQRWARRTAGARLGGVSPVCEAATASSDHPQKCNGRKAAKGQLLDRVGRNVAHPSGRDRNRDTKHTVEVVNGGALPREHSPSSETRQWRPRHHQSVSDRLASPPRLSRVGGGGTLAPGPRQPGWSPPSEGRHKVEDGNTLLPLGLSSPVHQDRNIPISEKVWHTVSVSRRKHRKEAPAGDRSPPAITLTPAARSERFRTQPPVRPAVLFGSDPARELEFNTYWGKDNNAFAVDAKLGYQVPRLWFPHAKPGQAGDHLEGRAPASAGVSMPGPRPRASGGADQPIGSDAVVQEYQQMQTFRTYSALAQTRPTSAEPLHGVEANAALVSTLGKLPEEEDAAIAQEWSPRRGRRPRPLHRAAAAAAQQKHDDLGQQMLPLPSAGGGRRRTRSDSSSRSPRPGREERGRRRPANAPSVLRSPRTGTSLSCSPVRRGRGRKRRRRVGRRGGGEKRTFPGPHGDDDETLSLDATSDEGSSGSRSFDASRFLPHGLSPSPARRYNPAAAKPLGNLGGPFMLPGSPYRTYRAKHYRLLRAQSSERAAARARREKLRESLDKWWVPRSRSVDGAGRRRARRHGSGSSGMTSPLLRGGGFGLLQSRVTQKVALGYQLPRDRCSASGRERAAAAAAEQALRAMYKPVPEPMSPGRADRKRKTTSHLRLSDSLSDEEEITYHDDDVSPRPPSAGYGDILNGDSGSDSSVAAYDNSDAAASGRGREGFPVTRHFARAGMRWPSPPKRTKARPSHYQRRYPASLGRTRDDGRRRRRRLQMAEESRGGRAHGGCYSWSPPRTRTQSYGAFPTVTTASSSRNTTAFDREEGRETAHSGYDFYFQDGAGYERAAGYSSHRHRSLSPFLLPLDPYRGSRTVVRAGSLVSRRDAAAAEVSSRRAALVNRRASESRVAAERHTAEDAPASFSSPGHGRRGKQRRRTRGVDVGSLGGGGQGHGWATSGATQEEDEELRGDRIRRFLPSVESMGRELEAIKRADAAVREEQLAQVQLNTNALPLALLLVHPGGAARVRDFVARALSLWQREKSRARMTQALARWKIECEAQRFRERGLGYRTRFGALKIK